MLQGTAMINLKSKISITLILLAMFALYGSPSAADSGAAVAVTVVQVKYEQRGQPIRNSGRVSQKSEMHLSFKTGGLVQYIGAEEGDEVKSGQVLAELDLEEINAQQQRAESNYEKAALELQRFSTLYDESLLSLQVKQNAETGYDSAAADLQIANFNRKLSTIRAPSDGRILKRYVESHELIEPGQPVFLLAASKQGSVVRVGLVDRDIVKVSIGDPASVVIDAYPGRKFAGSVSEVALGSDSAAGTFEVEVLIDAEELSLRSGLIARVEITLVTSEPQYYIPIEAVFEADNGKATLFVLNEENGTAHEVSVEVLALLRDEVAVRGELSASDKVIKLGTPYLSDGSTVAVFDES